MKEFQFTCPHCGQRFHCDARLAGRTLPCPRCGERLVLPPQPPVTPAKPEAPKRPPSNDSGIHLP